MAETEDGQERSQEATEKRRGEAREKGQIARSRELTTVFVLFGGAMALQIGGADLMHNMAAVMRGSLRLSHAEIFSGNLLPARLIDTILAGLYAVTPMFVAGALVAVLGPLALGGWNFSIDALAPKFSRLDPWAGLKRVLGPHGVMEMLKAAAKFGLILAFATIAVQAKIPSLLALSHGNLADGLGASADAVFSIFLICCSATIVIAFIDVPLQLWQHAKQLRMSQQEVRDEMKETDGSPEMKSRIRAMQQEASRRRMMAEVPKADVIITNPQHYAVALKFKPDSMRAPIVVAKGADLVAKSIRELAASHGITVMCAPPLARAIYHTTKLNREIPAGLYVAVARVLAYVFQLRAGDVVPTPPVDLPIPDDMHY